MTSGPPVLRFGAFELDPHSGELRRAGVLIKLQPQPFKVLALLASRAGTVVTREEIQREVWGADTFVDFEHGLNYCIKEIRAALGDDADTPHYIETLPKRGYRFLAPVESVGGEEAPPETAHAEPPRKRPWAVAFVVVAVLAVGGVLLWRHSQRPPANPTSGKIMLVVLPFQNLTGDPEQEYFSDGLTEEMITQLGRLNPARLGVIARTSAMRYKNTQTPTDQIARELGVDYILEGSVRRAGDRVRISAQLIQASDQTHAWAEPFELTGDDVLALQREVAERIAQSLALELLPGWAGAPNRLVAQNPSVYEDYLKGRYYLNKRTEDGFQKGFAYFQSALRKDPGFAPAYAGEADYYILLGSTQYGGVMPPRQAMPRAMEAARKALELDNTLGEAHASLAYARLVYDWDWKGAEEEFRRAIELDPAYAGAHHWYAIELAALGRNEESLAEIERAHQLDPLSLVINVGLGWHSYFSRDYARAIEQLRSTVEMDPTFPLAHFVLGMAYEQAGRLPEAEAQYRRLAELTPGSPAAVAALGHVAALAGRPQEARQALRALEAMAKRRYVSPIYLAVLHTALGDRDQAFHALDEAYDKRAEFLVYLRVEPVFDPLRSDPRFARLLARIGLEPVPSGKPAASLP